MDLHMPGGPNGVEATAQVRRAVPTVGVLVLTMVDVDESVQDALRAGPAGYVLKGASRQQIVHAIHAAAGLSTTAIAVRLGVEPKTVTNNLSAIFAKLGVASRTEAALLARDHGLGRSR